MLNDQKISVEQLYGEGNLFPPPVMPTHCTTPDCNNRTDIEYPFWCPECSEQQAARLDVVKQEISDRIDAFLRPRPEPVTVIRKPSLQQEQLNFEGRT